MLRPCMSPYCECSEGKCTHPGCYDARDIAGIVQSSDYWGTIWLSEVIRIMQIIQQNNGDQLLSYGDDT